MSLVSGREQDQSIHKVKLNETNTLDTSEKSLLKSRRQAHVASFLVSMKTWHRGKSSALEQLRWL